MTNNQRYLLCAISRLDILTRLLVHLAFHSFKKGLNLGLHLVALFNILNDGGVLVLGNA